MTTLTDAQFAVFERLTERTFLVLDTEYCKDPDGGLPRLVSLGLTPIVRGKRAFDGELYVEMNPGVPIDAATTAIHGFTDADVARKRRFAHYAPAILRALADDDAVLVVHTGADVGVLRGELERLDGAGDEAIGIDDLPDLPIVDTSTLPRLLRHPVAGTRPSVSLRALCDATGVANRSAHNAKSDARATADALIQLLVHAAASTTYGDINALLVDHDRGTTRAPRLALHIVGRGASPRGSAQHLARHVAPLTHAGSEAELHAWVELAASCVQVRCEHLRTEARLAAAENGPVLLRRLVELLPAAAEPGQAGTLVGAITALLEAGRRHADPPATEPAMTRTMAMHWWRALRPGIESSAPCAGKRRCPDCWEGNGCPRDTLYKPVARVLTFGDDDSLSRDHIRRELIGPSPKRRINSWRQTQPRIAAHMVWLVAMWCDTEGISHSPYTKRAAELDLHAHDHHLALLLCRERSESGAVSAAQTIASEALRSTTSDPAYDDLQAWATWQEQTLELASRRSVNRTITHPRLARPDGRVNANPYVPKG